MKQHWIAHLPLCTGVRLQANACHSVQASGCRRTIINKRVAAHGCLSHEVTSLVEKRCGHVANKLHNVTRITPQFFPLGGAGRSGEARGAPRLWRGPRHGAPPRPARRRAAGPRYHNAARRRWENLSRWFEPGSKLEKQMHTSAISCGLLIRLSWSRLMAKTVVIDQQTRGVRTQRTIPVHLAILGLHRAVSSFLTTGQRLPTTANCRSLFPLVL